MINFYFDPISPYAWLASTQLDQLATDTNLAVIAKPILFAGLLKAHGHQGPAEIPAKRAYTFADVMRRANSYGLNLEGPPAHPFNPLLALRSASAIDNDAQRLHFAKQIMHAAWSEGADITTETVVGRALEQCEADADSVIVAANSAPVKQSLIEATDQAISLGIFGVPSFEYEGELFWGDDRLIELKHCIAGRRLDKSKLNTILSRSAAANRQS